MGAAPADLFSLGVNMLPHQGMDVVPLLAVAVAEHQIGIEEPGERGQIGQFLQVDPIAVGDSGQPERINVWGWEGTRLSPD